MPAAQGVLKGMGAREKQLLTAETLEADMEQRKKLLAEAEAGGGNKLGSKRVNDLKFEISQLELSITAAKNEYEKIKTANVQVGTMSAACRTCLQVCTELMLSCVSVLRCCLRHCSKLYRQGMLSTAARHH